MSDPPTLSFVDSISPLRGAGVVLLLAVAAYANSLGNGFAYDDARIVEKNPAVVEGGPVEALTRPWWPDHQEGAGLYRPITLAALSAQWQIGEGDPLVFHATNVVGHALVSLALFLLLLRVTSGGLPGATLGAGVFAVHPVHVEAVANVVGQGEILAGLFCLVGSLIYLWEPGRRWYGRPLRLLAIGSAYALSLGSKEMGATFPALLLLLELLVRNDRSLVEGVRRELPVYLLLFVVGAAYAGARYWVLGSFLGEVPAAGLRTLGHGERLLTALSLWPEYARLLLFPIDLSAAYGPAVLLPARGLTVDVVLGGFLLAGLLGLAVTLRRSRPGVSLGVGWFAVAILPVSQILFPAGVLLAERTLYLPSVGLSLALAAALGAVLAHSPAPGARSGPPAGARRARRVATVALGLATLLLLGRTVTRNPVWFDSYSVMQSLVRDHPESSRSARAVGRGLIRAGRFEEAAGYYDLAVELDPHRYEVLTEAAALHGKVGDWPRAGELLERAVRVDPRREEAYRLLARHAVLKERPDAAHEAATAGLFRSHSSAALWSLLSESYVLKGDLPAAIRSREAALAVAPDSSANWARMAELRRAVGDWAGASKAGRRVRELEEAARRRDEGGREAGL